MTFLYTARETFDKTYDKGVQSCNSEGKCSYERSWNSYIEWSKLTHLTELLSLDGMLIETLVESDYDNGDDWRYLHMFGQQLTGFFTTPDYVFKRLKPTDNFNLLTVVIEPDHDCKDLNIDGYEFVGYELLDQHFGISPLTNCGPLVEAFLPSDLNDKGLIDDFDRAYDIKKRLLEKYPEISHADTNVIAVWRHKTIGR
jgi:hypothetical protein